LFSLGKNYDSKAFGRHIAATRQRFFPNFRDYVKPIRRWYRKHETENPYKVASQVYIGVLSQAQLYQEGNHRTGSLIASGILLQSGCPPFVLTRHNAVAYFDPSSEIKFTDNRTIRGSSACQSTGGSSGTFFSRMSVRSLCGIRRGDLIEAENFTRKRTELPECNDAFEDFVAAYRSKRFAILAQTAFWTAVRAIALAGLEKANPERTAVRVRLELEDDDGSFWFTLTSETELHTDRVGSLLLPTPRQSPYRFLLKDLTGKTLVDVLFSYKRVDHETERAIATIRSAVAEGFLLFEETDDHVSVLSTTFPSSGRLRALVSDRLMPSFTRAVERSDMTAEIQKSAVDKRDAQSLGAELKWQRMAVFRRF
jgi:hypothetical protein